MEGSTSTINPAVRRQVAALASGRFITDACNVVLLV